MRSVASHTPRSSRDLILAAIAHQETDRIPVDMGATPSSGISAIAYERLLRRLGIVEPTQIYDVVQYLAQPSNAVLDALDVDVVDIGRTLNTGAADWYQTTMPNGRPGWYPRWFTPVPGPDDSWDTFHVDGTRIATMPSGAVFFDQTHFPWLDGYPDGRRAMDKTLDSAMDHVMWSRLVHSPWDHASESTFWDDLREQTRKLRESTDRALLVVCGCNLFEWGTFLRRMDNFLMDLYTDEANVSVLIELLTERHLAMLEHVCEAVGDLVDVIRFGDDLGMDSGPFMSLEVYRRFFHQPRKRMCEYVHANSTMHTFLHTCGSVRQYIPSLIEEGIEIINPVQTNCRGMEPAALKREFGSDIVFWGGGVDTRQVLNRGTPEQVRDDVRRRLGILAPGGGFVFTTIHNALGDVPPDNLVAAFEAVREFGR